MKDVCGEKEVGVGGIEELWYVLYIRNINNMTVSTHNSNCGVKRYTILLNAVHIEAENFVV